MNFVIGIMKNIFMIHGAYGGSEENWFSWLRGELERNNYQVFVPNFPTPEGQNLENWMKVFAEYEYYFNEENIFIGYSLGAAFILSVLEKLEKPVKACFFASGFIDFLGNKDFDEINKSFVDKDFDWERIRENCRDFYIYHSDNDPYVPTGKARDLADRLGVDIKIVEGAGHFNHAAGYDKFEVLLEDVFKV